VLAAGILHNGQTGLYAIPTHGGKHRLLTKNLSPFQVYPSQGNKWSFAASGKWVVFVSVQGSSTTRDLTAVPAAGGKEVALGHDMAGPFTVSPSSEDVLLTVRAASKQYAMQYSQVSQGALAKLRFSTLPMYDLTLVSGGRGALWVERAGTTFQLHHAPLGKGPARLLGRWTKDSMIDSYSVDHTGCVVAFHNDLDKSFRGTWLRMIP